VRTVILSISAPGRCWMKDTSTGASLACARGVAADAGRLGAESPPPHPPSIATSAPAIISRLTTDRPPLVRHRSAPGRTVQSSIRALTFPLRRYTAER
jgi:hypothetical protein